MVKYEREQWRDEKCKVSHLLGNKMIDEKGNGGEY